MTPKPAIESDQKSTRWQDQSPWKEHFERIEAQANEPIERDPKAEQALWGTHIAPIIKKHSLRRRDGKLFEYHHFEKYLTLAAIDEMVRKTSHICMSIKFPKAGVSADETGDSCGGAINFSEEVVRYLRDCKAGEQRFELKAGGEVDLCRVFQNFLDDVFENKTLPEFIIMLAGDGFGPGEISEAGPLTESAGIIDYQKLFNEVDRCYAVYKALEKENSLSTEAWMKGITALGLHMVLPADVQGIQLHQEKRHRSRNIIMGIAKNAAQRISGKQITLKEIGVIKKQL